MRLFFVCGYSFILFSVNEVVSVQKKKKKKNVVYNGKFLYYLAP